MPREIDVYGLLMPGLLPILIAVGALYWMLDLTLARLGIYQHVWHPPLFRLSFFVCLFVTAAWMLGQ